MGDLTDKDPSSDLFLAFVIGASAAFFLLLPPALKTAALHGALIGAAAGTAFGLLRRHAADPKKGWVRYFLGVPVFAAGAAFGFVAVTWLASRLPAWIAAVASAT